MNAFRHRYFNVFRFHGIFVALQKHVQPKINAQQYVNRMQHTVGYFTF